MLEVVGDSSRDGRWALVRLTLDGDRIAVKPEELVSLAGATSSTVIGRQRLEPWKPGCESGVPR